MTSILLTDDEIQYLADWALGGATPSHLMVRAVECILADRIAPIEAQLAAARSALAAVREVREANR